jgi:hypothetical protein
MTILSNGKIEFSWAKTSGSTRKTTSTVGITDMEWHHVACVFDAANELNTIYVDGLRQGSSDATGTPYTGPEPVILGARGASSLSDWLKGDSTWCASRTACATRDRSRPPTFLRGGAQRHIVDSAVEAAGIGTRQELQRLPAAAAVGSSVLLGNVGVDTPTYTDISGNPGTTYRYTIKARNSANVEGPASAPLDVPMPQPTDVTSEGPPSAPGARLRLDPNPIQSASGRALPGSSGRSGDARSCTMRAGASSTR